MMELDTLWHSAPTNLVLSENDVHIWRTELNLPTSQIQQLAQTLSPDEENKANRFYFEKDRNHFIAGRGILRTILSCYLNLQPDQFQFAYSSRGKPALADMGTAQTVSFNVSHSKGLALYAITHAPRVGIDLEFMRPMPDAEQLAKRFFCDREYGIISALPDNQKQEAFFRAWTCKEAYLKAIGDGLPGLDKVEVCLIPGEPAALVSIKADQQAASKWFLHQMIPAPGYMAALALEGQGWNLKYFNFTSEFVNS